MHHGIRPNSRSAIVTKLFASPFWICENARGAPLQPKFEHNNLKPFNEIVGTSTTSLESFPASENESVAAKFQFAKPQPR